MNRTRLIPVLLVALAAGCNAKHSKADVERGRTALAAALDSWKAGEPPDRLKALPDPVEFTDEIRQTHKLIDYTLGKPDARDPEVPHRRRPRPLRMTDWTDHHPERPAVSFDGGDLDCGNGLLLLIRKHIDPLEPGQLLEIKSADTSVEEDLPAWCRLTGKKLLKVVVLRWLSWTLPGAALPPSMVAAVSWLPMVST